MQSTAEIYDELDNLKYLLETSSSLDDVILNLDQKTVKCITFEYVNQGFHNTPEDFQVSDPDLIDLLKRTTSNWFITKSKENEDDLFQSIENANSIIQYNRRTGGNFSTNEKHSVRNCDDIPIRTR
ncbi:MAG: hypothetical protein LUD48_03195, partial [Prevotella sp.]|nr:hypothetical protein [Prevotella sp.]